MIKRWVLRSVLKPESDSVHFTLNGSTFQRQGAAIWKLLSPHAVHVHGTNRSLLGIWPQCSGGTLSCNTSVMYSRAKAIQRIIDLEQEFALDVLWLATSTAAEGPAWCGHGDLPWWPHWLHSVGFYTVSEFGSGWFHKVARCPHPTETSRRCARSTVQVSFV